MVPNFRSPLLANGSFPQNEPCPPIWTGYIINHKKMQKICQAKRRENWQENFVQSIAYLSRRPS
jgi:hypothetical protein